MKKILMALTMIGMVQISATAQNSATSRFAQNYPVCPNQHGYQVCAKPTGRMPGANAKVVSDPGPDEYVSVGSGNNDISMNKTYAYSGYMRRHNIVVNDGMDYPYEGKPSAQYDGPVKDEYRNMNAGQTSIILPPNDGNRTK